MVENPEFAHLFPNHQHRDAGAPPLERAIKLPWDESYEMAVAFMRQHGRRPSSRADDAQEKYCGKWLSYQKTPYDNGKIPPERRAKYESMVENPEFAHLFPNHQHRDATSPDTKEDDVSPPPAKRAKQNT
jgi:hypothetical protein